MKIELQHQLVTLLACLTEDIIDDSKLNKSNLTLRRSKSVFTKMPEFDAYYLILYNLNFAKNIPLTHAAFITLFKNHVYNCYDNKKMESETKKAYYIAIICLFDCYVKFMENFYIQVYSNNKDNHDVVIFDNMRYYLEADMQSVVDLIGVAGKQYYKWKFKFSNSYLDATEKFDSKKELSEDGIYDLNDEDDELDDELDDLTEYAEKNMIVRNEDWMSRPPVEIPSNEPRYNDVIKDTMKMLDDMHCVYTVLPIATNKDSVTITSIKKVKTNILFYWFRYRDGSWNIFNQAKSKKLSKVELFDYIMENK